MEGVVSYKEASPPPLVYRIMDYTVLIGCILVIAALTVYRNQDDN